MDVIFILDYLLESGAHDAAMLAERNISSDITFVCISSNN